MFIKSTFVTLFIFYSFFGFCDGNDKHLIDLLKNIPEVTQVNELPNIDYFSEVYEVYFSQYIDYTDTSKGRFDQRFLISHADFDSTVIFELEGYALYSSEAGELASKLKANQVCIEHRYFDKSKPLGNIDWNTLTVKNAAQDQHRIISAIRESIYINNKYISTGISKGGQTTLLHRMFYPDDVDGSVCYVTPLNFQREDTRIYEFLNTVGSRSERKAIQNFQEICLSRKKELSQVLGAIGAYNGFEWSVGTERAFELYVLEYSFAFWQWGRTSFNSIPNNKASNEEIINHLLNVSGVSFFEDKGIQKLQPFFCAGMSQMGIYGYEIKKFKKYLSSKDNYDFEFTLPVGYNPIFNPEFMFQADTFIQEKANNMIFIYGALDTWFATAVEIDDEANASRRSVNRFVLDSGHHETRISNFSLSIQHVIWNQIKSW